MLLSRDELAELTGKTTPAAQVRALAAMGVPFLRRPDGTPAVAHSVVSALLGQHEAGHQQRRPQLRLKRHAAPQT